MFQNGKKKTRCPLCYCKYLLKVGNHLMDVHYITGDERKQLIKEATCSDIQSVITMSVCVCAVKKMKKWKIWSNSQLNVCGYVFIFTSHICGRSNDFIMCVCVCVRVCVSVCMSVQAITLNELTQKLYLGMVYIWYTSWPYLVKSSQLWVSTSLV